MPKYSIPYVVSLLKDLGTQLVGCPAALVFNLLPSVAVMLHCVSEVSNPLDIPMFSFVSRGGWPCSDWAQLTGIDSYSEAAD